VGHVLTCIPHPDADRLKLTTVDMVLVPHTNRLWSSQCQCRAKSPVATIGTVLYDKEAVPFTIKKEKLEDRKATE
jgi:phenylalanyl-tRNA synthetase beta chain